MTSEMVASVVHSGRATLNELRTIYHLQDLYSLWEIDYIPLYNQWIEGERQKERDRLNSLARQFMKF
ncbi:MAG: hypothetical protein J6Q22_10860 [Prevotella sp.]|nr:hypothetical protein [Prevotella sp.]